MIAGLQDLDAAAFQLARVGYSRVKTSPNRPVQQSTQAALTLNLKTAKTLRITFAEAQERAYEVIE